MPVTAALGARRRTSGRAGHPRTAEPVRARPASTCAGSCAPALAGGQRDRAGDDHRAPDARAAGLGRHRCTPGRDVAVGGLTAAEMHGLKGWQRPDVTVLIGRVRQRRAAAGRAVREDPARHRSGSGRRTRRCRRGRSSPRCCCSRATHVRRGPRSVSSRPASSSGLDHTGAAARAGRPGCGPCGGPRCSGRPWPTWGPGPSRSPRSTSGGVCRRFGLPCHAARSDVRDRSGSAALHRLRVGPARRAGGGAGGGRRLPHGRRALGPRHGARARARHRRPDRHPVHGPGAPRRPAAASSATSAPSA